MRRQTTTPPAQAHILLVDHNHLGLSARRTVLEEHGYRITTAKSAKEALQRFAENKFDLVVTDCKMPDMSSVQLIEELKTIESTVSVILISSYVEALGLTEQNTGADAVMLKGANEVAVLLRSVSRLLRKKPPASVRAQHTRTKRKGAS